MVYVDPKNLGYEPFWLKWVNSHQSIKPERDEFARLYKKCVVPYIVMIIEGIVDGKQQEKMRSIIPLTYLNLVS